MRLFARFLVVLALVSAIIALNPPLTLAQGLQLFSTQASAPVTSVDLATSNVLVSIPIRSKIGAIPFQYSWIMNYSTSGVQTGGGVVTGAGGLFGGALPQSYTFVECGVYTHLDQQLTDFVYTDSTGARHPLNGPVIRIGIYTSCDTIGSYNFVAIDGSGYALTVTVGSNGAISSQQVWDISGNTAKSNVAEVSDPDGNTLSSSNVNNVVTYTDTLGEQVLQTSGTSSDTYTYIYTDNNGGNQTYTVASTSMTWRTNFTGCATNYNNPGTLFPTTITETPSGQQYTLAYEPTPGYPGDVTGRIQQITLPSGGYIKYTYSGGSNGLNCSGSGGMFVPTLTKTISDNNGHLDTWTYANTYNSSSGTNTVVETDPAGNQSVYTFYGEFQTELQVYQGPVSSNNLISTTVTCYNGNFSNCPNAGPAPISTQPIPQTDVFTYRGTSTSASLVETKYNPPLVAEVKKYDFGAAATLPPTAAPTASPISDMTTTYDGSTGSCGTLGTNSHIGDRPCSITAKNSSGAVVSQVNYTYNSTGHATQTSRLVSGSTFLTSSASYNSNGRIATFTDVNSAITDYSYNGSGGCNNLLRTSTSYSVNSLSTSQTWNCNGGVLTSSTDANGQVTNYGYVSQSGTADPFWRVLSLEDPLGNTTYTAYSEGPPMNQETSLTFNGGASTVDALTTFDGIGRRIFAQTRQAPGLSNFDSAQYAYGWTSNTGPFSTVSVPYVGTQAQSAPAGTKVTTTQTDPLGRPLSVTDGGTGTLTYTYSNNDVLVAAGPAATGEHTKRRQLEYDGLGRVTSVCEITAGTTAWPGGNCAQKVSQTGYWTKYAYDALADLLTVTQNSQASSGSQQTRTYAYDAMSRLTSEINPESGTTAYTYDSISSGSCANTYYGDRIKRVDAIGNISCYTYDAMHRPLTITYSTSSPTVTTPNKCFVYDAVIDSQTTTYTKSRLAEAYTTTSACSITTLPTTITDESFSYTKRGELTSVYELTPHTSPSYYQVFQTYWANHAPNVLSGNIGLPTITYGVDGEGRISAISASAGQNPVTSTTYNMYASPNQLTVNFGSGDSDVFSYDPSTMRMNKYQFKIGSQTIIGTLGWNANWSLGSLNISDPFSTTNTQNCSYTADDLARISQVSCGTTWGQNFAYDPFGNIQKNAISGTGATSFTPTYASSPTTNRVASVGGNSASYDANGNSLNDTFRAFTWDAENRPVTIGSAITVAYDALGRAVEQSVSSTYSEVVYSPAGVKLALMNAMTLAKAFVPLTAGDAAVYTSSTGPAYYRHTDHLGSSRFASTTSQTLYADSAYSPFGEPYSTSGAIDLSFTEENEDTTAGLYDFLHREYDPNQSRWTSPDPAGLAAARPSFPQSWNRYAYVLNNPLASVDPAGYDCVYLNDAGNDTEYIDTESDVGGCGLDGGYWIPGTVDPNSVTIFTDSGWITTDSNTGLGTFASPCSGAGCGLDATNNNWLTPSTFGSSGILADSPGNWLNADSTTGMPTMAGLSYSDQLFGALIQGAYMAEPGINAALAITAPQDLLIAVDAALLLPEVSSGTACVAGSVGYGAAVGYLGSQSENSYNNALYGGPVANGSAYATALGGGTGYLTGAATCPP